MLTEAREGKVHDKRLLDEEEIVEGIPDEIVIAVDLGLLGLQKEYDNIEMPPSSLRTKMEEASAEQ